MNAKCNCNNCSTHLEFDSANAGQTINCPSCGMETKLYLPPPPPVPRIDKPAHQPTLTASSSLASGAGEQLKQIRHQTCYKTLRSLIDLVQIIIIGGAALTLVGAAVGLFRTSDEASFAFRLWTFLGIACGCFVAAVLSIAGKQAALLLVDIADCQIQGLSKA
jgi:hypothetical protein